MSQTSPATKSQTKEEVKIEAKKEGQEKNDKEVEPPKTANQFVYYIPHENQKKTPPPEVKKTHSSGSEKSSSRSRSREKQHQKHKTYKQAEQDSYNRHERGGDRYRRSYHDNKYKTDSLVKQESYRKTKMCPQFERGQCRKGSECNFAHSQSQLRGLPDFRKTKLCIAFKEGKCGKLSSECKYAHGQAELRKAPKVSHDRQFKKQKSPRKQRYPHKNQDYNYPPPPMSTVPPNFMPYHAYMNPYSNPPLSTAQYGNRPGVNPYPMPPRGFNQFYPPTPTQGSTTLPSTTAPPYGTYYPPPPYDYYGQYSNPPPPGSYGYPPSKPPM